MSVKKGRSYRKGGLEFQNLEFSSRAERQFVKAGVERIAMKIRKAREEKGLSQERLAELASISVSTLKFIEQNQRAPSLPMLFKLLFILDRNVEVWKA